MLGVPYFAARSVDPMAAAALQNPLTRQRARGRALRNGAATLEFAIVAPIIFLSVITLIQFCGLLMSQNMLTAAAREGGRVASLPGTSTTDRIVAAVGDRLRRGGINPSLVDITVEPSGLAGLQTGDNVSVSLSGEMSDLTWVGAVNLSGGNLSAEATYTRE